MDILNSNILIVDDEKDLRNLISSTLSELNVNLFEASNAKDALELLSKKEISLVITDYRMPNMDGLTLIHEINKLKLNVTIIMLTAYADKNAVIKALQFGVFDFIEKPFDNDVLKNRVKNGLEKARNTRLLKYSMREFLLLYCNINDPDILDNLDIKKQNKLMETAFKVLALKNIQKEFKSS